MTPRALIFAFLLISPRLAVAQVGHDPASSPYRTLRYGQFLGLTGGYIGGSGGSIGVAPHQGEVVGIRYEFLGTGTVTVGLEGAVARLQRNIVDAYKPIDTGRTGPFDQNVTFAQLVLQFNLTGGKSWHGIAPFVSSGAGLAIVSKNAADTSGFKFRTKFALTPSLGARIFLSPRLVLRVEARSLFWQITYPDIYRRPPVTDPTKNPVITGSIKEWTTPGWYQVGLSYAFHRPF